MQTSDNLDSIVDDGQGLEEEWEPDFQFVKHQGVSHKTGKCVVRIASHNILARNYTHPTSFATSSPSILNWENRSKRLLRHLLSLDADILCLQELDEYENYFKPAFQERGYQSVYLQRNGKSDGCGTFSKGSKFTLLAQNAIDYNNIIQPTTLKELQSPDWNKRFDGEGKSMLDVQKHYKMDCVGLVATLRCLEPPRRVIMVANTHLYFDPVFMQVKLAQAQYLGDQLIMIHKRIHKELHEEPLVVIVGDFNTQPNDEVYQYMTSCAKNGERLRWKKVRKLSKERHQSGMGMRGDVMFSEWFPLPVVSLYDYLDREPFATNLTYKFQATLDYIFFIPGQKWEPLSFLKLPPPHFSRVMEGLPNSYFPSDHLPVAGDFEIF